MSFHPSPSIDCRTTPMEVLSPFIQHEMDNQDRIRANGAKPAPDEPSRSRSPSTIKKICCDYYPSTGQYIFRCPPTYFNKSLFAHDLLCITQIGTWPFYQALLSEFLGTLLLTLVCTSTGLPIANSAVPGLHGALAAGFVIATIVVCFGHVSGAHINPAVTVSFLVASEIDAIRAFCYIGMQLLGATAGSCLLRVLAPLHAQGNLGVNTITEGVTIPQAVLIEAIITFILCTTVHAICDKQREDIGGSKALGVGLAIIVGALFGGPYTGASMNPARSFGPATVTSNWTNHWVYWLGPMIGSVLAAIIYKYVLQQRPPIVVRTDSGRSRARAQPRKNELV